MNSFYRWTHRYSLELRKIGEMIHIKLNLDGVITERILCSTYFTLSFTKSTRRCEYPSSGNEQMNYSSTLTSK